PRMQSCKVSSRVGRNKRSHPRRLEPEPRALPKTGHGDVREPGPALPPVDPQTLQAGLNVLCQARSPAAEVVEGEHGDAPGLAIAGRGEMQIRRGVRRGRPQLADDGVELTGGP